ncbi:ParB N-terminal domain-containing protein [Acuticoccus sediminis]|uniref:ParB N-terminal domain-containing protein n=1 Tax=Acuticoccus sediminis TaxID=2184697 RepID=UPI001CFC4D4F|nr:ParB N-terminal domain-containing protein [Acuticoccus sediminis]
MRSGNKFGFGPLEEVTTTKRERSVGPMGAAVREAAESLQETTEAKIEQRRRNAEDAKSWRSAQVEGRVLVTLPLGDIETTDLPRDRLDLDAVAGSDEMEELKSSIRARGQKEPVAVYLDDAGRYQLKQGWRRLTALRQLFAETGDPNFEQIVARVEPGEAGAAANRVTRYIDMVEENVIREDLTFAEMAQVAIAAAADPMVDGDDAEAMVGRLYGSLHKMKRSYIRSFVFLLTELKGSLKWPKELSRNVGVDLARIVKAQPERLDGLRTALGACATPDEQGAAIAAILSSGESERSPRKAAPATRRDKVEFRVGAMRITARDGECRIVTDWDFTDVPRETLERAIQRFEDELGLAIPKSSAA